MLNLSLRAPLRPLKDGRLPVITSGYRPRDRPNHVGIDMFYHWKTGDKPDFVGDHGCAGRKRDGTPKWVVPFEALAYAAAPGIIQLAGDTRTGARVWIDHGNGYRTGYFHLLETSVRLGSFIDVLDPVGEVGDNPNDHDGRHIHFELSPIGVYKPIDPEPFIHHGDYEDY